MTTSNDLAPVTAAPDHETRTTPSARRSSVCARPGLPIATASRAALYLLGAALAA